MSTTYHAYSLHRILLRRSAVVIAGILALPVMLVPQRSRAFLQLPAPRLVKNQR